MHRLLRQPAYYYRPADCADYFGDMAKAAGEAALYTVQVCGGASLASIQADDGAACAAYIESRAADVGALGANVEIKLYNPAPFAVTVSTLLVTVTESSCSSPPRIRARGMAPPPPSRSSRAAC